MLLGGKISKMFHETDIENKKRIREFEEKTDRSIIKARDELNFEMEKIAESLIMEQ